MSGTTNYSWPLIAESQTQKYQTHNDALQAIDTKVHDIETGSSGAVSSFNTRTGAVTLTATDIANLDLSGLPTSNPGSGKLWLNGGVLQVGA